MFTFQSRLWMAGLTPSMKTTWQLVGPPTPPPPGPTCMCPHRCETIHRHRILQARVTGYTLHIERLHRSLGRYFAPRHWRKRRSKEGCAQGLWTPQISSRGWQKEDSPVDSALLLLTSPGTFQEHTSHIYMAKFLAELLGCTLPDKGTPPLFEVRKL